MRRALVVGRRSILLPRGAPPGPEPGTETVLLNAVTSMFGTVNGGPSNNVAGATIALSDLSDSTYLTGEYDGSYSRTVMSVSGAGFADLQEHAGRNIASFVINTRVRYGNAQVSSTTITPAATPSFDAGNAFGPTLTGNSVCGPFTRSGGGTWTAAQFNALTIFLEVRQSGGALTDTRMIEVSATVTYDS